MRKALLAPCMVLLAAAAGCSRETPPPPPISGLDLALFDAAVRPQDDLSLHVNGGWLTRTEIPADRPSYGAFNELFDQTQEQLRVIVEEAAAPGGSTESRKIGDFYTAFMDEGRANALGLEPLADELAAIDALDSKAAVARHMAPLFKRNVNVPIVGFDWAAWVGELVEHLRASFREGIDGLEWMSAETKVQAEDKLAKFRPKVGYPNRWRDFSGVEVQADDLVGNVMRAVIFEREYQLGLVGTPIDPERWAMTPQTVNAYYNPVRNEIVFPAAILQPPFFNLAADDAVNYGAGCVIGHEMGHGFDDQGRSYDGDGVLRDWWTEADGKEYRARAQKLAEYVSRFEALPGVSLNGAPSRSARTSAT